MKIKSIQFDNHKILGNLYVNFCNSSGIPADTILIAGENGTGKSTLLNEIYKIVTYSVNSEMTVVCENDNKTFNLEYYTKNVNGNDISYVRFGDKEDNLQSSSKFKYQVNFSGIFSDVDINFHSNPITNVTSLDVDVIEGSRKSDGNITQIIQQLIIDIQATDDAALAKKVRELNGKTISINDDITSGRITRFIKAFQFMFNDLSYDGVENSTNQKKIIFKRGNQKIYIDELSSGEKQIVYRGSFMLKDINALNGAIVFIDEPEISMHPEWQKKIMDFYKQIFTDETGRQTSQIFAVTHSPFVIHNDFRKNDKVIVLARDENSEISFLDKSEYYICNSKEAVKDAFRHDWYEPDDSIVYLEGRTDENFFNKAIDIFGYNKLPFKFKWIGHIDDKGQEEFTGKDSLAKAYQFSLSNHHSAKQIFLFDCDTKRTEGKYGTSYILVNPQYNNPRFKAGIENALVIDAMNNDCLNKFYSIRESVDDYGGIKIIPEFKKMEFCDYVCSLDHNELKPIFSHLDEIIKKCLSTFSEDLS